MLVITRAKFKATLSVTLKRQTARQTDEVKVKAGVKNRTVGNKLLAKIKAGYVLFIPACSFPDLAVEGKPIKVDLFGHLIKLKKEMLLNVQTKL